MIPLEMCSRINSLRESRLDSLTFYYMTSLISYRVQCAEGHNQQDLINYCSQDEYHHHYHHRHQYLLISG